MDGQEARRRGQLGRAVRDARRGKDWSQAELAAALTAAGHKASGQFIGGIERGEYATGPERLYALEDVLGVEPGTFARLLGFDRPDSITDWNARIARLPSAGRKAIEAIVAAFDPDAQDADRPATPSGKRRKP